jgi:hypothetical protein
LFLLIDPASSLLPSMFVNVICQFGSHLEWMVCVLKLEKDCLCSCSQATHQIQDHVHLLKYLASCDSESALSSCAVSIGHFYTFSGEMPDKGDHGPPSYLLGSFCCSNPTYQLCSSFFQSFPLWKPVTPFSEPNTLPIQSSDPGFFGTTNASRNKSNNILDAVHLRLSGAPCYFLDQSMALPSDIQ